VRFDRVLGADEMRQGGAPADAAALGRTRRFLDLVRAIAGIDANAAVDIVNHFPTASGLASSASGFAALALAATRAAGVTLDGAALSRLARQGSGSAARSIFGGFVRMFAGERADEPTRWPGRRGAAGGAGPHDRRRGRRRRGQDHGSRDAMEHCAETSPLYAAWIAVVPDRHRRGRHRARRSAGAGRAGQANALAMHASAIAAPGDHLLAAASSPPLRSGRCAPGIAAGHLDAGPHVKVLTSADDAAEVARSMATVPG
jgi:diphosphomevalonate decarboxylase